MIRERQVYTSFIQTTATLGLFLSLLVILGCRTWLGTEAFDAWGWRIPFLVSVVLLGISVWIRLQMNESPAFKKMKEEGTHSKAPLSEAFGQWRNAKFAIIALFGLVAGLVSLAPAEAQESPVPERPLFESLNGWQVERATSVTGSPSCVIVRSYVDEDDDDADNSITVALENKAVVVVLTYGKWQHDRDEKITAATELGGKDPGYVMDDADLDAAAATLVDASMYNSGQCCCGIERSPCCTNCQASSAGSSRWRNFRPVSRGSAIRSTRKLRQSSRSRS